MAKAKNDVINAASISINISSVADGVASAATMKSNSNVQHIIVTLAAPWHNQKRSVAASAAAAAYHGEKASSSEK